MLRAMDAAQALGDLTEISSQVVHVAIIEGDGSVLATTISDASRASRFVQGVTTLLVEADDVRQVRGLPGLSQLEAATHEGSVFVVRREAAGGGTRIIAATTRPDPTVGLVFYDLKHCLRSIDDVGGTPNGTRRRTRKKAEAGDAS
jgi:predicted regulator of Ras-like GTPase activity (Roadblock/LC7/MglB family)